MAENRNTINIKSDESGEIKVADEVVAIIAGLAASGLIGSLITATVGAILVLWIASLFR